MSTEPARPAAATAVRVAVMADEAELAADALWQAGAVAIEEQPGALVGAMADGGDPTRLLAAVAGRWPAEAIAVDLDSALDAWRPHARAVAVGDRLVVRPPWIEPPVAGTPIAGAPMAGTSGAAGPGAAASGAGTSGAAMRGAAASGRTPAGARPRDVVIDPGRAFGHGAHPTTRLVLDALTEDVRGGERVLDVGCGSGVLAIAALALGAGAAVGVDVDPAAVAATRTNAARNGVADRLAVVAEVDDVGAGCDPAASGFDLVVANMLASQLVRVASNVVGSVAPGGTVVLSGLLASQRDLVLAAYAPAGEPVTTLAVVGEREDEGWLCLTLRAG